MKISTNHRYSHNTGTVYSVFTDTKEIRDKQKALGARKIRVLECERDTDGAIVRFVRELPAEVPGILSRFLQPWNSVEQSERWRSLDDDIFESELTIDIANVPVTVVGTLKLKPLEDGCVNQVRLVIECGIPFVGKSLAEFVAADCKRLIDAEYKYIIGRLASA
ncbi:MAG: DUF2505 domain-containing protein [Gammaproteobacteria bacterium]|nr:DUF2505 domain-containing protein [Gammaproteobacteria bacterium]NNL44723.1 DUF2505 domain-containing protein [Woeseiaceae bacterium]